MCREGNGERGAWKAGMRKPGMNRVLATELLIWGRSRLGALFKDHALRKMTVSVCQGAENSTKPLLRGKAGADV